MHDIRPITFSKQIPKIGHLLQAHFSELDLGFPCAISAEMYRGMERAGVLFALAAFVDGQIAGYCTVTVTPHPFNPAVRFASHDLLFVSAEHRRAGIGAALMQAAEQEAQKRGAMRMLWGTHAGTGLADSLIKHGYEPVDVIVMKEI